MLFFNPLILCVLLKNHHLIESCPGTNIFSLFFQTLIDLLVEDQQRENEIKKFEHIITEKRKERLPIILLIGINYNRLREMRNHTIGVRKGHVTKGSYYDILINEGFFLPSMSEFPFKKLIKMNKSQFHEYMREICPKDINLPTLKIIEKWIKFGKFVEEFFELDSQESSTISGINMIQMKRACDLFDKMDCLDMVRQCFVYTRHTPEDVHKIHLFLLLQ